MDEREDGGEGQRLEHAGDDVLARGPASRAERCPLLLGEALRPARERVALRMRHRFRLAFLDAPERAFIRRIVQHVVEPSDVALHHLKVESGRAQTEESARVRGKQERSRKMSRGSPEPRPRYSQTTPSPSASRMYR